MSSFSFSNFSLQPQPWDQFLKVEKPSSFSLDILVQRISKTFPQFTGHYLFVLAGAISLAA